jgi:hypothetical protein
MKLLVSGLRTSCTFYPRKHGFNFAYTGYQAFIFTNTVGV